MDTTGSSQSEDVRRRFRGCDAPNLHVDFDWSPFPLQRCPYALVQEESPQVWDYLSWWQNWQLFRILPFGSSSLLDEPAIVYDAIKACATFESEARLDEAEDRRREADVRSRR